MVIFSPIAVPISWLLDWLLGKDHSTFYRRNELKELIQQHKRQFDCDAYVEIEKFIIPKPKAESLTNLPYKATFRSTRSSRTASVLNRTSEGESTPLLSSTHPQRDSKSKSDHSDDENEKLTRAEVDIIKGALELKERSAQDVMTPIEKVFMISINIRMDKTNLERIKAVGFSRIPVYNGPDRNEVIGTLITKELVGLDPAAKLNLSDIPLHPLPLILPTTHLHELLSLFVGGDSHICMVVKSADQPTPLGLISFEDVIEALIGVEIVDETDNPDYMNLKSPSIFSLPSTIRSPSVILTPSRRSDQAMHTPTISSSYKRVAPLLPSSLSSASVREIRESLRNPSLLRLSAATVGTPESRSNILLNPSHSVFGMDPIPLNFNNPPPSSFTLPSSSNSINE